MAQIPIFHGAVTDAVRIEFVEAERYLRHAYLKTLIGRNVECIVRKERVKRSLDMNAYLHAVPFPLLAEYFGDSIEGTKLDLMGECFGWRTAPSGHQLPVKPHTSDMTVEESAFFVDWLIPWAAKLPGGGVRIPLPGEVFTS
jgi:hypothetical protein